MIQGLIAIFVPGQNETTAGIADRLVGGAADHVAMAHGIRVRSRGDEFEGRPLLPLLSQKQLVNAAINCGQGRPPVGVGLRDGAVGRVVHGSFALQLD